MSDVFAIFGILLTLGIAFPGMLAAWWLLFPDLAGRASQRLGTRPWSCFWLGLAVVLIGAIPIALLVSLPVGLVQFTGWSLAALMLAFASLGATGLAAHMGMRLDQRAPGEFSPFAAFLRGAITLELAAIFPVLGWLIVIPGAVLVSLGAAVYALRRRSVELTTLASSQPLPAATPQV